MNRLALSVLLATLVGCAPSKPAETTATTTAAPSEPRRRTPQQIIAAIDFVRANSVPAVFCESTVSDAPMQQVVGATGAKFGGTLYVDSLSEADGPVPTYLDMIRHDTDVILGGLTGGKS